MYFKIIVDFGIVMCFFITLWDLLNVVRNAYHKFYQFKNISCNTVTTCPCLLQLKHVLMYVTLFIDRHLYLC